jgi:hypothetical protein
LLGLSETKWEDVRMEAEDQQECGLTQKIKINGKISLSIYLDLNNIILYKALLSVFNVLGSNGLKKVVYK